MSALHVPRVLSIAGVDPSGGAGGQADLKAIAAAGGYGMQVVSALTAQNTQGVRAIEYPSPAFLLAQLEAVREDVQIDAIKIGMLGQQRMIDTVSSWLEAHPHPLLVLDPVMVATSGDRLLEEGAQAALKDLAHRASVLTPNTPELAILAGEEEPRSWDEACQMAQRVAQTYQAAVIVKSGHLEGLEAGNALVTAEGLQLTVSRPRLASSSTHGTGCSLSAALATRLGAGDGLPAALTWVTGWLHGAIASGHLLQVGSGQGPVNHFWQLWKQAQAADSSPIPLATYLDLAAPAPRILAAGPQTDYLWKLTGKLWKQIMSLPMLEQLAEGSLAREDFSFYQDQDALYLQEYSRALALLSAKAPSPDQQVFWARGAAECISVESQLHQQWLGASYNSVGPSPVTRAYTDFLTSTVGTQDYPVAAAAVLPCYWLYAEIGEVLADANHPEHPYAAWLSMYGSEDFRASVQQAIATVEKALADASPALRVKAAEAYQQAAWHELNFFDQTHRRPFAA